MSVFELLQDKQTKLSIVGLGYVGLPLAIEFSHYFDVIGFDINREKILRYKNGIDMTNEVGNQKLAEASILFTSEQSALQNSKFHIICVPTPINEDKTPDLRPIIGASEIVGRNLTRGAIVVYESTVYPGLTENVCIPILEKVSGMSCGIDFKVGYSPERINPGDKIHNVANIIKIVSGIDNVTLNEIANVYGKIVKAGIYKAENIMVAEAAKVIENSQRDINIAFMNELSIIFNKLGIDTKKVLKAAGTKWNFLNFTPGLVGGHCIGIDPYYLTYKAEQSGYHPQVILAGRRINDSMGKYIAENTVKLLIKADKQIKGAKVLILGFTFKENVSDTRNTKVIDIINELKEYNIDTVVVDPVADKNEAFTEYKVVINELSGITKIDAVILAVAHDQFKSLDLDALKYKFNTGKLVFVDVKRVMDKKIIVDNSFIYWGL